MFERFDELLISRRRFALRMIAFAALALAIDALAVVLGAAGYHGLEGIDWLDAIVDSALVITGNGPRASPTSPAGALFLAADALLGGIVFALVAGVVLAPLLHRLLHSFHLRIPGDDGRA